MIRWIAGAALFSWLCVFDVRTAEPDGTVQYTSATKAFQDGFYERADRELSAFLEHFASSPKAPEAALYRGESLLKLKQFDPALELLTKFLPQAAALTDEFIFWIAEAQFAKGDFTAATIAYARLTHDFPQSPRAFEASVGEALGNFKLKHPQKTVDLLRAPEGIFAKSSASSTNEAATTRGGLLLVEALLQTDDQPGARAALKQLEQRKLSRELEWERTHLAFQLEMKASQFDAAIKAATNLVAIALQLPNPAAQVISYNRLAEVYQRLGNSDSVAETYDKIASMPGLPIDDRRTAVLNEAALFASIKQFTNATQRLERFIKENPEENNSDLLHIRIGETLLNQFQAARATPQFDPASTNLLQLARNQFDFVINQLTNSSMIGRGFSKSGMDPLE